MEEAGTNAADGADVKGEVVMRVVEAVRVHMNQ